MVALSTPLDHSYIGFRPCPRCLGVLGIAPEAELGKLILQIRREHHVVVGPQPASSNCNF